MAVEFFETYRSYLFAVVSRMLGSVMDTEEMVLEIYLRYSATPPETISSLKTYLTTITSRLCVDQLQLARRKREQYLDPWLPDPLFAAEEQIAAAITRFILASVTQRQGSR